jgi:glutathione peroxidase
MFEKVEVNGNAAHPVFRYLKNELPGVLGDGSSGISRSS